MEEQREIEAPLLLNNTFFCSDGESPTNNDEKKEHFLLHKEKHKNTKKANTDRLKSIRKKGSSNSTKKFAQY